jgi:hypothetical protein
MSENLNSYVLSPSLPQTLLSTGRRPIAIKHQHKSSLGSLFSIRSPPQQKPPNALKALTAEKPTNFKNAGGSFVVGKTPFVIDERVTTLKRVF